MKCQRDPLREVQNIQESASLINTNDCETGKTLAHMKKTEMQQELRRRGCNTSGNIEMLRARLREKRLCVGHRLGWLAFSDATLSDSGLQHMELPAIEPLRCLKGHIENILCELQHQKYSAIAQVAKEFVKEEFHGQNLLRSRHYMQDISKFASVLEENPNVPETCKLLVTSLANICSIMYCSASTRTAKTILQLYCKTFLHDLTLRLVVGDKPASVTKRKMYELYYHKIMKHAPLVNRLVALSSLNAEQE